MSKISLEPNASGAGTFTLAAPNSNTNRTLNLPDESGVVITDTSDLAADKLTGNIAADRMKDGFNATGDAPIYACRTWVNFSGSNSTIRASGNVSSVTRNSAGNYTVNFTTAMPDANFSAVGGSDSSERQVSVFSFTTTTAIVRVRVPGGAFEDTGLICVAILR